MAFEKLKNQKVGMPTVTPLSHNPGSASVPARQPGAAEKIGMSAASTGMNTLATKGAETLFASMTGGAGTAAAGGAAAAAAPLATGAAAAAGTAGAATAGLGAAGTAAATGAAAGGFGGLGALGVAAMTNPITAPLAIGAALFGGKKLLGK
jgi:hypothetical protein